MNRKVKGVGLLSGGLDSTLAYKVLEEIGVEVIGVTFATPFFGPTEGESLVYLSGVPARVIDFADIHLDMVKKPVYGYGSQMNPCIDCHGLMLREAGRIMEAEGADFLFTGEVLGQRPMSQRRDSMRSVEKLSGYPDRVLRPLSARLLPPTLVESEGLVDRERLLDINGRSRKRQEALARHFGIEDYPQPGGGCLLTKEGFANKLKALLEFNPNASPREVEMLKHGRQYRLPAGNICVIGRHQADNRKLDALSRDGDATLKADIYPGPTCLVISSPKVREDLETAAMLVASYSDAPVGEGADVRWKHGGESGIVRVMNMGREAFRGSLI